MRICLHCTSGYDVKTDLQQRHPYEGLCVVVKCNWTDWSKVNALCLFTAITHDTEVTNAEGSLSQAQLCHKTIAQNNN